MSIAPAAPFAGVPLAVPGAALGIAHLPNNPRISEKTVELSCSAQIARGMPTLMVWFGLTQKQERVLGFDAATNLGGKAFLLQYKASDWVMKTGKYRGHRRFPCQNHQMDALTKQFGGTPNTCFYFFPNLGVLADLIAVGGDFLTNSFLMDVAGIHLPLPAPNKKGYHYAHLDAGTPQVEITSSPFRPDYLERGDKLLELYRNNQLPDAKDVAMMYAAGSDTFGNDDRVWKRCALAIIP
jgi:hypothetical protein